MYRMPLGQLFEGTGAVKYLFDMAIDLYTQAKLRFYVEGEGWFDTEEKQPDLFVRTRAFYDGAVPAATSMIFDAIVTLAQITGKEEYVEEAVAAAMFESGIMQQSPDAVVVATSAFHRLLQSHPERFNESFEVSLANPSPVRMSVTQKSLHLHVGESRTITLRLQMAEGWHVNSNKPESEYAVPLNISVLGGGVSISVTWPESEIITSVGESVRVYGGVVEIPISVTATSSSSAQIMVTWQACNEESCLAKETHEVPCKISAH